MPQPPLNPTLDGNTWRDTMDNLQTQVAIRIYQNPTRDIDGTTHQFEDIDVTNVIGRTFFPMDGDNILVVRTTGDPATDGASLLTTYERAAALTPNGQAKSTTNRVTVALPPGVYSLGNTPLNMNTPFVDLCGLGGPGNSVLITSTVNSPTPGNSGKGTIYQTANDIRYTNLRILNTASTMINDNATDTAGYSVDDSYPLTIFTNCLLDAVVNVSWCTRLLQNYSGQFINCKFGSRGFHKATGVGLVIDGYFGDNPINFGTGTGEFHRCYFGNSSFGSSQMDVRIYNSVFDVNAFGSSPLSPATCILDNCTLNGGAFGNAGRAGEVSNCTFGQMPFGALSTGMGNFFDCVFHGPWSGANANFGGRMEGCRIEMGDEEFVVAEGAALYDTTIITTADPAVIADNPVTASIAHCRLSAAIDASVTNDIGTPFNVIDANLQ